MPGETPADVSFWPRWWLSARPPTLCCDLWFPISFPKEAEAPSPSRARSLASSDLQAPCGDTDRGPGAAWGRGGGRLFSQPSQSKGLVLGWPPGFPAMDKEIFLCYSVKLSSTNKNYSFFILGCFYLCEKMILLHPPLPLLQVLHSLGGPWKSVTTSNMATRDVNVGVGSPSLPGLHTSEVTHATPSPGPGMSLEVTTPTRHWCKNRHLDTKIIPKPFLGSSRLFLPVSPLKDELGGMIIPLHRRAGSMTSLRSREKSEVGPASALTSIPPRSELREQWGMGARPPAPVLPSRCAEGPRSPVRCLVPQPHHIDLLSQL